MTKSEVNKTAYEIIGAAIEVNKILGPGLLESVYHDSLIYEMKHRGLSVRSEEIIPLFYKGVELGKTLRLDILVNNCAIVELKAVETMVPIFQAQLLTYMRLSKIPKGILINFNTNNIIRSSIHLVNEYFSSLPL